MIKQTTIERMKRYTAELTSNATHPEYIHGGSLLAKDVFPKGSDIFINLHTIEVNSISSILHGHDFFELNYVIKGSCQQKIDDEAEIEFKEGSICIMNPNARHNIHVNEKDDIVLNIALKKSLFTTTFWSLIEQQESLGQFFLDYFLALDPSYDFLLFHLEKNDYIEQLLDNICQDYLDKKPYNQLTMRCMLIIFFTEIIRLQTSQIAQSHFTNKVSVRVTALFQYLSVNYATATLASTAAYFHYHPSYLSAFIKKHTGKTFSSILNEIKLSQATYYLLNTNMPIKTISEKLGFQQLCNFYDFIRKNHGTTPVKYRQAHSVFPKTD